MCYNTDALTFRGAKEINVDWTNLELVLKFLVGGGAPAVVIYALSWVVENFAWWGKLPAWSRKVIPVAAAILLAVGAQILLGYADIIKIIAPWFVIIVSTVIAWIASQKAYMTASAKGYGERFKARDEILYELNDFVDEDDNPDDDDEFESEDPYRDIPY